mmetsp:Transcript_4565/g.13628  ORF Transcript_4565/g.13628 Transcript_4565/m.13628 type:complete len:204 (-) Transcript_4565:358-969(-)
MLPAFFSASCPARPTPFPSPPCYSTLLLFCRTSDTWVPMIMSMVIWSKRPEPSCDEEGPACAETVGLDVRSRPPVTVFARLLIRSSLMRSRRASLAVTIKFCPALPRRRHCNKQMAAYCFSSSLRLGFSCWLHPASSSTVVSAFSVVGVFDKCRWLLETSEATVVVPGCWFLAWALVSLNSVSAISAWLRMLWSSVAWATLGW